VASADVQILGSGAKAAPLDYTLPLGSELLLKAVRADFDGTGAAGAFLPALEIISDAGHSVGLYPTDVAVAAGGSASVSFAPFLRNTPTATASTGLSMAIMTQIVDPFADTAHGLTSISLSAGSFDTNDSAVFSSATSGGITTIKATGVGTYMAWATVLGDLTLPPAAGSYIEANGLATSFDPFNQSRFGTWFDIDGFGDYEAGAVRGWVSVLTAPPTPPTQFFFLRAGQNSGHNIQLHANLTVVRMSATAIA
jgi:hypothetical protein